MGTMGHWYNRQSADSATNPIVSKGIYPGRIYVKKHFCVDKCPI
jgi:hypothetical protein